jgi:DNA polymerase-3 subunit gamma/tau
VFVLCTTEVHKIPNTIGSRCQQFSFRSVEFDELMERMQFIAREEGIEADTDALAVIAQAGEGSVRDSLSALDQAIACCGKVLKVETVRSLLGMFGADSLRSVAEAVRDEDGHRMLEIVQDLEHNGHNLQHYCRELARYWRNLLVARIAGKPTRLIAASDREQQTMLETASQFGEEDLTRYLQLTLDLYKALQVSLQPRFHMELGLIKLVQAGKLQPIEEALAGLASSRPAPLRAAAPAPRSEIARLAPPTATKAPHVVVQKPVAPEPKAAAETAPTASQEPTGDLKSDLQTALLEHGLKMSADAVQHSLVKVEGAELVFTAPKRFMLGLRDSAVAKAASTLLGKQIKVRIEVDASVQVEASPAPETEPATADAKNETAQRALNHPGVKRFQELFPDAQVRSVRNLNE